MRTILLLLCIVGTARAAGPQDAAPTNMLRPATDPQNVSQKSGNGDTSKHGIYWLCESAPPALQPIAYPEGEPPAHGVGLELAAAKREIARLKEFAHQEYWRGYREGRISGLRLGRAYR